MQEGFILCSVPCVYVQVASGLSHPKMFIFGRE